MSFSVAMIVNRFPVRSQTFVVKQIAGLMQRGVSVDIYSRYGPDVDCLPPHPDVVHGQMLERTYHQSILPGSYPTTRRGRLARKITKRIPGRRWQGMPNVGRIEPWHRAGRRPYDIVHCQFGYIGLGLPSLRAFKKGLLAGKLVVSLRGNDISEYVRIHGDRVYHRLFQQADLFLANCEHFRQKAIALGCDPTKVIVHGSGIDCQQFSFSEGRAERDGRIRILSIGRLVEKKGFEYTIRAVAKLVKQRRNIELEIIGDGPLRDELEKLISDLDMDRSIRLIGAKNSPEVLEKLKQSEIFVATSVTARDGDQDGPVNTLKEAMAVGLPVVATRHGGIPELVEDGVCGFLVAERDVDALVDRIAILADRPSLWRQFGKAGRRRVEQRYDIRRLTSELIEVYERLLNPRNAQAA